MSAPPLPPLPPPLPGYNIPGEKPPEQKPLFPFKAKPEPPPRDPVARLQQPLAKPPVPARRPLAAKQLTKEASTSQEDINKASSYLRGLEKKPLDSKSSYPDGIRTIRDVIPFLKNLREYNSSAYADHGQYLLDICTSQLAGAIDKARTEKPRGKDAKLEHDAKIQDLLGYHKEILVEQREHSKLYPRTTEQEEHLLRAWLERSAGYVQIDLSVIKIDKVEVGRLGELHLQNEKNRSIVQNVLARLPKERIKQREELENILASIDEKKKRIEELVVQKRVAETEEGRSENAPPLKDPALVSFKTQPNPTERRASEIFRASVHL